MNETESFRAYFLSQFHRISKSTISSRYKKLAYMNLLDTMSHVLNDEYRSNQDGYDTGKRFSLLMRHFSPHTWESEADPDRICIVHLARGLELCQNPDTDIFDRVQRILSTYFEQYMIPPGPISIIHCPQFSVFKYTWPTSQFHHKYMVLKTQAATLYPWDFTFQNLFYNYRNVLVHGTSIKLLHFHAQDPDLLGIEVDKSAYPHYRFINSKWQLFFPILFFENLVVDCIQALVSYLERLDLNPLDFYRGDDRLNGYFLHF